MNTQLKMKKMHDAAAPRIGIANPAQAPKEFERAGSVQMSRTVPLDRFDTGDQAVLAPSSSAPSLDQPIAARDGTNMSWFSRLIGTTVRAPFMRVKQFVVGTVKTEDLADGDIRGRVSESDRGTDIRAPLLNGLWNTGFLVRNIGRFTWRHPKPTMPFAIFAVFSIAVRPGVIFAEMGKALVQVMQSRAFEIAGYVGGALSMIAYGLKELYEHAQNRELTAYVKRVLHSLAGTVAAGATRVERSVSEISGEIMAVKRGAFGNDRFHQALLLLREMSKERIIRKEGLARAVEQRPERGARMFTVIKKQFPHFGLDQRAAQSRLSMLLDYADRTQRNSPMTITKALWVLEPKLIDAPKKTLFNTVHYCNVNPGAAEWSAYVRDVDDLKDALRTKVLPMVPRHISKSHASRA